MITPNADALVAEGIELDRHYVFYFCAPTRSSLMSGRLPYHVNQLILSSMLPGWDMPKEMTAMPKELVQAGCKRLPPELLRLSPTLLDPCTLIQGSLFSRGYV